MKKNTIIILCMALCILAGNPRESQAYNSTGSGFRSEYATACQELLDATTNAESCVLCHSSGNNLNSYGSDLANASRVFADIENMDSDGDGRTNIEEILTDCTFPGDMVSPVATSSWSTIKALYR